MSILTNIIEKDRELFVFLNSLGNENWDSFWLAVTNKFVWIPLYLLILFLLFRHYGWKKTLVLLFITAMLITFTDQFVNIIKNTTQRLRPNNDPTINEMIRIIKNSGGYSFVSGHATTSFATAIFIIATLRKHFKPIYFILLWPILFAYSRVYLGVHYPVDISLGMLLGLIVGYLFYRLSIYILSKVNS